MYGTGYMGILEANYTIAFFHLAASLFGTKAYLIMYFDNCYKSYDLLILYFTIILKDVVYLQLKSLMFIN